MLLNYIGKPSIYLPVCMMIWGTLSILTGQPPCSLRSSCLCDPIYRNNRQVSLDVKRQAFVALICTDLPCLRRGQLHRRTPHTLLPRLCRGCILSWGLLPHLKVV